MSLSASNGPSGPSLPRALDRARGLLACLGAYLAAGALAAAMGRLALGLHPILTAALADLAATLVVFLFSLAYNNSSIYDPYWSLIPPFLALFWLLASGLLLAWAVRLTFNWLRRWRGLSHEDWRYAGYRQAGAAYWPISFAGFHLLPTAIVFLGCLSLWPALTAGRAFGALDVAAALFTAGAILFEAAADRQLARFLRSAPPQAILSEGLWSLSRHPNYFGEVAFWWGLWLFGLAAAPGWWWTAAGPLAMTGLFVLISVPMMDRHLASRRPGYAAALKNRSAFLPWFPRR